MSGGGPLTVGEVAAVLGAHRRVVARCACTGWHARVGSSMGDILTGHDLHVARMVLAIPRGRVYSKPRGTCSVCPRECAIRQDGTVQAHGSGGTQRCPGSHRPPRTEGNP